jgi:serine protease inhibitor
MTTAVKQEPKRGWLWIVITAAALGLASVPVARWWLLWRFEADLVPGRESRAPRDSLAESYNAMGFEVFSHLTQSHHGENVLVSPISLAQSLGMLAEGASGQTRQEIAKALRLNESNSHDLAERNAQLLRSLAPRSQDVKLDFANGFWINQRELIRPEYVSRMKKYFRAQVRALDFTSSDAAPMMNLWVKDQSHGKIPRLFSEPLDPNLQAVQVNTIYFKAGWANPFDAAQTHDAPFVLLNGQIIQCPQMRRLVVARHCDNPLFEAAEFFFSDEDWRSASMCVLLPKRNSLFEPLLASLNTVNWKAWRASFGGQDGTVALPRFKLSGEHNLVECLRAAGIERAFTSDQADFHLVAPLPLCIAESGQAVSLDVNEKGVEAAAATELGYGRGEPHESFVMVVARPFVMAICAGDTILFLAAITDPR